MILTSDPGGHRVGGRGPLATAIYISMDHIRHGPGPPHYHLQHGSGGTGQVERSTSTTTQHHRYQDVSGNPVVRFGVEQQSDVGYSGIIGDGSRADRVCGLRPSFATPMQPHKRHSATPTSIQRGTNFSSSHNSSDVMQLGYDDGDAADAAKQSFGPTRERPRSLDLAHGSPQFQPASSLPFLPHRHQGWHGSNDARCADENENARNLQRYSEGGHALRGSEELSRYFE